MRDARLSSSRTLIDWHLQKKMDAFVRQMALCDASTTRFSLTIWSLGVENIDGARERFLHSLDMSTIKKLLSTWS